MIKDWTFEEYRTKGQLIKDELEPKETDVERGMRIAASIIVDNK